MTLERAKQSVLDHLKEKGTIQGYVNNSAHKEVLEFLEKEMPEIARLEKTKKTNLEKYGNE